MSVRYRITKYDPAKRDRSGRYPQNEWTSVYDMGSPAFSPVLTLSEYLRTEEAYTKAVADVMQHFGLSALYVYRAELHPSCFAAARQMQSVGISLSKEEKTLYRAFKSGLKLTGGNIPSAVRMILRELCWAELVTYGPMKVEFGYDYYMYITCPVLPEEVIRQINSYGLFVESSF